MAKYTFSHFIYSSVELNTSYFEETPMVILAIGGTGQQDYGKLGVYGANWRTTGGNEFIRLKRRETAIIYLVQTSFRQVQKPFSILNLYLLDWLRKLKTFHYFQLHLLFLAYLVLILTWFTRHC